VRLLHRRHFENPRVILLDQKLLLVDGMVVLRQIRGDPRTRLVPAVMLAKIALLDVAALKRDAGRRMEIRRPATDPHF